MCGVNTSLHVSCVPTLTSSEQSLPLNEAAYFTLQLFPRYPTKRPICRLSCNPTSTSRIRTQPPDPITQHRRN
eukprot:m.442474 g.442474  ORF g.442474 m.442474 type:complete len:73 (-) comp18810_c0_seq1:38-256(-)